MKNIIYLLVGAFLVLTMQAYAAPISTFKFKSDKEEALYFKLSNELRCLVCQNESIANSNAGLAKDLRTEMYEMLQAGKTEDQIIDYMVKRYGDYVLYDPPVKPITLLLWFGPAVIFFIGVFFAFRFIRAQQTEAVADEMSESDIERLKNLQSRGRGQK
jgi:cytochrome c-type biogenesis protein CcmH